MGVGVFKCLGCSGEGGGMGEGRREGGIFVCFVLFWVGRGVCLFSFYFLFNFGEEEGVLCFFWEGCCVFRWVLCFWRGGVVVVVIGRGGCRVSFGEGVLIWGGSGVLCYFCCFFWEEGEGGEGCVIFHFSGERCCFFFLSRCAGGKGRRGEGCDFGR